MKVLCSCTEYQVDAGEKLCSYCGPVPLQHTELTVLMKHSNIIDYPKNKNFWRQDIECILRY
ncbi:hypothetical protein Avbf_09303, partial [Armadillidium vulgare]